MFSDCPPPPHHPDLNPIEMVWPTVKNYVAQKNMSFQLNDAIKMTEDKFKEILSVYCRPVCNKLNVKDIQIRTIIRQYVFYSVLL